MINILILVYLLFIGERFFRSLPLFIDSSLLFNSISMQLHLIYLFFSILLAIFFTIISNLRTVKVSRLTFLYSNYSIRPKVFYLMTIAFSIWSIFTFNLYQLNDFSLSSIRMYVSANREGNGVTFLLMINMIFLSVILIRKLSLVQKIILFSMIAVVSSKALIVKFLLLLNFNRIIKLSVIGLVTVIVLFLLSFTLFFYLYSGVDINDFNSYVVNYFNQIYETDLVINNISKLSLDFYTKVELFFNSFWGYVPRAIYSDKPYVYGPLLFSIDNTYPGALATGWSPALLDWYLSYFYFGILGVFIQPIFEIGIIWYSFEQHRMINTSHSLIFFLFFSFGIFVYPINSPVVGIFMILSILLLLGKKRAPIQ